ncbi:MAG: hypothetical protein IJR88_00370 [Clostridia bacterium]|nr:hypothetical protein [Clostridia bacterium]
MASYELGPAARSRKKLTASVILLSLLLVLFVLLQTSFFGFYPIFGAVPDLTLVLVLSAGLFLGEKAGGLIGLFGGILVESLGSFGITLLPLLYFLLGFFAGFYGRVKGETFPGYLIYFGLSLVYRAIITTVYANMTYQSVNFLKLLWYTLLPEALATAVVGLLLFLPLRAFCRRLDGRGGR